jgi:peptidoglycan hydrolase CwlO-like protein
MTFNLSLFLDAIMQAKEDDDDQEIEELVQGIKNYIEDLEDKVDELKLEVYNLEAEVDRLNDEVSDLESQIGN